MVFVIEKDKNLWRKLSVWLHSIISPSSWLWRPMASPEWDVKLWPVRAERRELAGARLASLLTGLRSHPPVHMSPDHNQYASARMFSQICIKLTQINLRKNTDFSTCCATHLPHNLSYKNTIVTLLELTQLTFVFLGWSLSFRFTCQPFVHNLGIEQKQAPAA